MMINRKIFLLLIQLIIFLIFIFINQGFSQDSVTVISPNGGESWVADSTHTITWSDNFDPQVKIELYKGGVFHSIIKNSTISNGAYEWVIDISIPPASDYKVKISSTVNSNVFDFSDEYFTITPKKIEITVTSPNGGEIWRTYVPQTITWNDNITGSVKIELYQGGKNPGNLHSLLTASTPSNGSFLWNVTTDVKPADDYYINITSNDNNNGFDFSDTAFTFIKEITVLSPNNGGEAWVVGTTQTIGWTDNISESVSIDLFKSDTFYTTIAFSTGSDGSYNWDIPDSTTPGSDYKIKITSVDDPGVFDFSNNNFTIVGYSITVTSPNGGEQWEIGKRYDIVWTDNIPENVKIDLYKGGLFHSTIDFSTSSDGLQPWDIPLGLLPSSDYKIKITSVNDNGVFDISDNNFTMVSALNDNVRYNRIEFYTNVGIPSGNPNNYINPGKRIKFRLKITNALPTNILTGYGSIRSLTLGVSVLDSIGTYNNILAGQEGWSVDDYEIDVSSTLSFGRRIEFLLTVNQAIAPIGPWYSIFSFPIAPLRVNQIFLDDDQYPDSWGNNNKIPEPGETIEVIPLLNNTSSQTIYSASGRLATTLSDITIWNNVVGVSGLVYDSSRYNVVSGVAQPIAEGATAVQPELDYVFDYANIPSYPTLPFGLYLYAYLEDNPGTSWETNGILIRWENEFEMAQGIVISVDEFPSADLIPTKIKLHQNYPNPYNNTTLIKYSIPVEIMVTLKVYNVLGEEVITLVNDTNLVGNYQVGFNTAGLPSGIYFYRLQAGNFVKTKKMVLLR